MKQKSAKKKKELIIYQAANGAVELKGDFQSETIWATQAEISQIFDVQPQAITKHISNIYTENELSKKSTCSKMEQVRLEGKREVLRNLDIYNLEVIIAVGYRISSVKGTKFRQWANKILKSYITQGFVVNKKIIKNNLELFTKEITPLIKQIDYKPEEVFELIQAFSSTWISLDEYDKETIITKKVSKKIVEVTAQDFNTYLEKLKMKLMKTDNATELFATERSKGSIEGIFGNVMQSMFGKETYESVEEKAANLMYFIIKNHPFIDGNKRSGAFALVWFLQKADRLNKETISPEALTSLTLFVAQSNSDDKNRVIQLIIKLLIK